ARHDRNDATSTWGKFLDELENSRAAKPVAVGHSGPNRTIVPRPRIAGRIPPTTDSCSRYFWSVSIFWRSQTNDGGQGRLKCERRRRLRRVHPKAATAPRRNERRIRR